MIEILAAISLVAFGGFCLTLVWPHLPPSWLPHVSGNGLRPQYVSAQPRRVLRRTEPVAPPVPVRAPAFIPAPPPAPVPNAPFIAAPSYGRPREELIRQSTGARDSFTRDLAAMPVSTRPELGDLN